MTKNPVAKNLSDPRYRFKVAQTRRWEDILETLETEEGIEELTENKVEIEPKDD